LTMSTSTFLASLIVLYTFPFGLSANPSGPTFVVGDRSFAHVWLSKQSMPAKRSDMSATTVDDAIYLIGGCALDQTWVHDPPYSEYRCGGGVAKAVTGSTIRYLPKTNTHDTSLPDAPHPRYRHAAAALDNRVYLFGGTDGSGKIVPEVDVFSIATGKWTSLTQNLPNPTTDLNAFVLDGKIYVVGGYDPSWKALNVTQIFDPSASDAKLTWQTGPALLQGRGDAVAAVVDNKAYIVGGFHDQNNFKMPITDLEVLDVGKAGPWAARKGMAIARGDKAAASLNAFFMWSEERPKTSMGLQFLFMTSRLMIPSVTHGTPGVIYLQSDSALLRPRMGIPFSSSVGRATWLESTVQMAASTVCWTRLKNTMRK